MIFNKKLSKRDREEILIVSRLAEGYKFVAAQIKANTALVSDGQKAAKQFEDIGKLIDGVKNNMVSQKLTQLGYPQGVNFNIDLKTGKIKKA